MTDLCFISNSFPPDKVGSKEYYAFHVYNRVKPIWDVKVITKHWLLKIQDENVIQLDFWKVRKIGTYLWAHKVAKVLKEQNPKHVHAFDFRSIYSAYLSGLNFSGTLHHEDINYISKHFLLKRVFRKYFEKSDKVFVTNYKSLNLLKNSFKDITDKLELLPLGVDANKFSPFQKTNTIKKRLSLGENVILHVSGELTQNQELKNLIEAYRKLKKEINVSLLIIGKPSESFKDKYNQLVRNSPDVTFLEFVPHTEINKYYALADVFVTLPLKYDGVGLSILEAMASATPVICPPSEIYKEMGEENILTVPNVKDVKALTKILKAVLTDKKFSKTLGYKSRKYVMENYTIETMISKLSKYFEEKIKKVKS